MPSAIRNLTPTELSVLAHVARYPNSTTYQMRVIDKIPVKPMLLRPSLDALVNAGMLTSKETKKKNKVGKSVLLYSPTFLGVIKCFETINSEFPHEYTNEDLKQLSDYIDKTIINNKEVFPKTNRLLKKTPPEYRLDYLDHIWRASLAISGILKLAKNNPVFRIEEYNYERFLLLGIIRIITDELTPSEESLLNILRKIDPDGVNQVIDLILDDLKHKIANVEKAKNAS